MYGLSARSVVAVGLDKRFTHTLKGSFSATVRLTMLGVTSFRCLLTMRFALPV